MKAIILAAGYGSRMYPLCQEQPKCLLPINNGENLLDRQVRILKSFGIDDITVVTGFKREKIIEKYGEQISIRFNPHYEISGNAFSLWTAREVMNDDLIILNSDNIFDKRLIGDLLKNKDSYCLVIDKKKCDWEDQKARVGKNLIVEVGKHISLEKAYGEVVGAGKIQKEGIDIFKKALFRGVKENSHLNWPEVFNYLIGEGEKIHFILVGGLYRDLDTREDYTEAKRLLLKRKKI
jgi:L-glutamine-phosphate cytidylyltransferase